MGRKRHPSIYLLLPPLYRSDLNSNTHTHYTGDERGWSQGSADCDACVVLTDFCSLLPYNNLSACQDGVNNISVYFPKLSSQSASCSFVSSGIFQTLFYSRLHITLVARHNQRLCAQNVQATLISVPSSGRLQGAVSRGFVSPWSSTVTARWESCWHTLSSPLRVCGPLGLIGIIDADKAKPWF